MEELIAASSGGKEGLGDGVEQDLLGVPAGAAVAQQVPALGY